eukprot:435643-Prymnesium_polylepis.1
MLPGRGPKPRLSAPSHVVHERSKAQEIRARHWCGRRVRQRDPRGGWGPHAVAPPRAAQTQARGAGGRTGSRGGGAPPPPRQGRESRAAGRRAADRRG